MQSIIYPFSAIVGQEDLKLALILNIINPRIGGILIRGEKGTAKSTSVRGLRSLVPKIEVVQGCPVGCDPTDPEQFCSECRTRLETPLTRETRSLPLYTLPLNATEDMLVGGLDLEATMHHGRRKFQPGLLAKVHRGILYVDEVNLLDDHLIDIILDTATSGFNIIEREGISTWHPTRFVLVGTMNPEEGSLRPHLLDRFGLCAQIEGNKELTKRVKILENREKFDHAPQEFLASFEQEEQDLARRIQSARNSLKTVQFPERLRTFVAEICNRNAVAGHRADLVIRQASLAHASYSGRWEVTAKDIERVAPLALVHRRRDAVPDPPPPPPFDPPPSDPELQEDSEQEEEQPDFPDMEQPFEIELPPLSDPSDSDDEDEVFQIGNPFLVRRFQHQKDRIIRRGSGRRSRTRAMRKGRYVKSRISPEVEDIALDATLLAAAPFQIYRKKPPGLVMAVRDIDFRERVRERRVGNFILFLVDASGSMGAQSRMIATKGAILSLLMDAYQKRDRVAMVSFRRQEAVVNLQPTSSVELAVKSLRELPIGGRTPLSLGLSEGFRLLKIHLIREPQARPIVIILTDGKANTAIQPDAVPYREALEIAGKMGDEQRVKYIVVDTEQSGSVGFGLAPQIAIQLGADYFKIDQLEAQNLIEITTREAFWTV